MAKVGLVRKRSQATRKAGFRKIPCYMFSSEKRFMNYWWCGIAALLTFIENLKMKPPLLKGLKKKAYLNTIV